MRGRGAMRRVGQLLEPFSEVLLLGHSSAQKMLWTNYGRWKIMLIDKYVTVYHALCNLASFLGLICAIHCPISSKKMRVSRGFLVLRRDRFGSFCGATCGAACGGGTLMATQC